MFTESTSEIVNYWKTTPKVLNIKQADLAHE